MARKTKLLSTGTDNTLHLSAGVLGLVYPVSRIQAIIAECGKGSRRVRDLPASVVFYYVLALNLFPSVAYQSVLRWLLCGLQWLGSGTFRLCGKGSLSRARQRLGEAPMRRCFEQMARPLREPTLRGSYWKGWHLVAMDGSTFALQDTASNEAAFGRPSNQNGGAAYPQARVVVLAETGTHLVFGAEIGRYDQSEVRLARALLPRLEPGMLCLADRLFPGYELWKEALATGADLLWRTKEDLPLRPVRTLEDGSRLARWHPSRRSASRDAEAHLVRVVEYRLKDRDDPATYRLVTSITDPARAGAADLASLYPQRWEVELTIREGKGVLRKGTPTLRSKVSELVRQEFWGLLLAHGLVRRMMAQAARDSERDPDEISFQASVEIIKATQTGPVLSFPP